MGVENVSWDPGSVGRLDMGMGSDFQGAARGGCQPATPTLHLVSHIDARVHGKVFSCQGSPVMQSSEGPRTRGAELCSLIVLPWLHSRSAADSCLSGCLLQSRKHCPLWRVTVTGRAKQCPSVDIVSGPVLAEEKALCLFTHTHECNQHCSEIKI